MADLALTACCRRKALLAYFGEHRGRCEPPEELCDFCTDLKVQKDQLSIASSGLNMLQILGPVLEGPALGRAQHYSRCMQTAWVMPGDLGQDRTSSALCRGHDFNLRHDPDCTSEGP